jgi:DNA-directed RNA polymerase subunit M/transcription elongation factor TFIIS
MSWLNGYGISKGVQQPKPRPSAESAARKGRRRKQVEVPCCEVCDCHYVTIKTSKGDDKVWYVCRDCGYEWIDTRCDMIAMPRARRVMGP